MLCVFNNIYIPVCFIYSLKVKQADPVEERDSRLWENLLHDANNILDAARYHTNFNDSFVLMKFWLFNADYFLLL